MIIDDKLFMRSESVVSRCVAGETLIVPVRGKVGDLASIYSFNETGSTIWRLLETPRGISELAEAITQEFDVDVERGMQDVRQFVNEMLSVGLVEVSDAHVIAGAEGPVGRDGMAAAGAA